MAGSFNHVVADNGTFTMGSIENLGDAHEALEECFGIIFFLTNGDKDRINAAAIKARAVQLDRNITFLKEKES